MHHHLKPLPYFRRLAFLLLAVPVLLTGGCGGGGGGTSTSSDSTSTAPLSPKTLIGAVIVMTYADGRAFTFTISSSNDNGVSRSDGRVTTKWIGNNYGTNVLVLDLAYGVFADGSLDNIFDDYNLAFGTTTTGVFTLRENTTSNTYFATTPTTGIFTITTYPPGG